MFIIARQRKHQVNEPTFLVWLRTSMALVGLDLTSFCFGLFMHEISNQVAQQISLSQ